MKALRSWYQGVALLVSLLLTVACAPTAAPPTPTPQAAPKVAAPTPAPTPTPTVAPMSFAGKTVTLLVSWSPGGAADITARQVVPFLGKYLPGNPTVVVQHMPGAGGLLGDNWAYTAGPKDGTFINQPSTYFSNDLFYPDKVKYDIGKVRWLGGFADTSLLFARADLGIKSAEELPKVGKKLFNGTTTLATQRDLPVFLFLKLLGIDSETVTGYGSSGDMRAAILRGELHLTTDSLPSYYAAVRPLVEKGDIVPLAQAGILQDGKLVRDPRLADVPTYTEVLVKLKGEAIKKTTEYKAIELTGSINGLIRGWLYPPGVPDGAYVAAAAAFAKLFADPEWIKEFEKSIGYKPITLSGAEAERTGKAIVEMFNKNPDVLELIRKIAKEEG